MEIILHKDILNSATCTLTDADGLTLKYISLEVLESVAKMRYALFVVAELLLCRVNGQAGAINLHGRAASGLTEQAR